MIFLYFEVIERKSVNDFFKHETLSLDFRNFSFAATGIFVIRHFSKGKKTRKSQSCFCFLVI